MRFCLSKNPTSALAIYYFEDGRFSLVQGNKFFSSLFGKDVPHFPETFVSEKHLNSEDRFSF